MEDDEAALIALSQKRELLIAFTIAFNKLRRSNNNLEKKGHIDELKRSEQH